MTQVIPLNASRAKDARREAIQYAPCTLKGFAVYKGEDYCCYITTIRAPDDKHPIASAVRPGRPTKFCIEREIDRFTVDQIKREITRLTGKTINNKQAKHIMDFASRIKDNIPTWTDDQAILKAAALFF